MGSEQSVRPEVTAARFIPFQRPDIIRACLEDSDFNDEQRVQFADLCQLLTHLYHFRFHQSLETLKTCFAPVNPDSDSKELYPVSAAEQAELEETFFAELDLLLDKANFEKVQSEDLTRAMEEESLFKIKLAVDFNDFEKILFYRRGETRRKETLVRLFGLKKRPLEFINYDRVVTVVKYKSQHYFDQQDRKSLNFEPGSTQVKLFRNVPRADLEMLFPNTEVRMKTIDKLLIGVPAAAGGIAMLVTKLSTTLVLIGALLAFWLGVRNEPVQLNQANLLVLAAGFGTLGAFLWKQFSNFKNRKIRFMKALADNLYFKNLDNNVGVFHRLIDAAEEEESKEAILAYYFLYQAQQPMSAEQLDRQIEHWFANKLDQVLDFEVADALTKLIDLGLAEQVGEQYQVVSLAEGRRRLDKVWDEVYQFN